MQIKVLGVGSELSSGLANPSLILMQQNKYFLINCGYSIFQILLNKKLISKIDRVFINNRESLYCGSLELFLSYRKNFLKKKTKFYGLKDHLKYLKNINNDFFDNLEEYFVLNEEDSITTMPIVYKKGVTSEAFYNYGLFYTGPTLESLLDTPQAREAKVIIHHVSFEENSVKNVDFSVLARAADPVKAKTWLIGYNNDDDIKFQSKVRLHGFAGFLSPDSTLKI
jgi:hypothetical protein